MIEQIAVRNFKSLAQFKLRLHRFNCLGWDERRRQEHCAAVHRFHGSS